MKQDLGSGIWKMNPTAIGTPEQETGEHQGGKDSKRQDEFLFCLLGSAPVRSVSEPNRISSGPGTGTEAFCLFLDANDCHWALEFNSSKDHLLQATSTDL